MSAPLPTAMTGHGYLDAGHAWRAACLVPRNTAIAALIVYRATVSPLYGDVCKYYPTCSAYAVGAVQQYGVLRGSLMAASRLARCHPWAQGGIDDVPVRENVGNDLTPRGFVVPSSLRKD
ncbi:MAG: membrane protein insertion efficiency factor YidD [Microbacterium sp.]|jgi:putative membrane protein insertion efficiency factor|nr:MAG: membrane protein insertion efficiency factor YidD [Microbacterium sp.]